MAWLRTAITLRRNARRVALLLIGSGFAGRLAGVLGAFNHRKGTNLHGRLATIARRHDDHTELWSRAVRQYPSDAQFMRNKVHAALCAGRVAEAEAAFALLLESGRATAADSRFVIGFAHIDVRNGNTSRLRTRVRRFLAMLRDRPDYRIGATRLNRIIFAHFPRHECSARDTKALRTRFLAMLNGSQAAAAPKGLLTRAAACEERLEGMYPRSLFYTDVVAQQRERFVSLVREKLATRRPFSFIRVGDGEAACLPYEPRLARHAAADAKDRERIWWGEPLGVQIRAQLGQRVLTAIWDADCIGLPPLARYLRELNLAQEDSLEMSLTGRGLRAVLYCAEHLAQLRSPGLPSPVLASCHLHQDLALWNCYDQLLSGLKELVLVSCHPTLADWIEARFGAKVARSVILPPDRVSGPLLKHRAADTHGLPQVLDRVADEIGEAPRGRLVLVGAGYPGKWLVSLARARGGVALDLGSVFDYWLGVNSRSYLDLGPV